MKKIGIHTSDRHLVERMWTESGGTIENVRRTGEKRYLHPVIERPLRINGRRHDVPAKLLTNLNHVSRQQSSQLSTSLERIFSNGVAQPGALSDLGILEMTVAVFHQPEDAQTPTPPSSNELFSYRVRQRSNGSSVAGKTVSIEIPPFDWETFKNTPNAQQFVKKAYVAEAKKQARTAAERGMDGESKSVRTMEEFLLVGLRFTSAEIKAWLGTRDWSKAGFSKPEVGKKTLEQCLPLVATDRGLDKLHMLWNQAMREKVYGYVANLADFPDDPVADYIASSLTKRRDVVRLGADDF